MNLEKLGPFLRQADKFRGLEWIKELSGEAMEKGP